MNSNEIYNNYLKVLQERTKLENKIASFVEKYQSGAKNMSNETFQQTVNKGYERLDILKKREESLHTQYLQQQQKEQDKYSSDIMVGNNLGINPSDTKIIGGVLSSNANESQLIGRHKTKLELENEKKQLLSDIKFRTMNHRISLAEASKLTNAVNTSYDFYDNSSEDISNNRMHR